MEISIFAKKRNTKDGKKTFYSFITKLPKKDGTSDIVNVKFPEDNAPNVDDCPLNIVISKGKANLSSRTIIDDETGKTFDSKTLWVKDWEISSTPFVDTSLDEYDI